MASGSSVSSSSAASCAWPTRPSALSRGARVKEMVSGVTRDGSTPADRSSAARPGRGSDASRAQAEARDGAVLALERHHVRDRPDGRQVRQGERQRRAAGLVRQQQLGHLEGHAGTRQAPVRVARVGPVRVHERDRDGQHVRQAVVVGDDDVDARRPGGHDLRVAGRAAVRGQHQACGRRRWRARRRPATARGPPRSGSARRGRRRGPGERSASTRMARPVRPSASKSPRTSARSPRPTAARTRASATAASGSSRGSWSARRPGRRRGPRALAGSTGPRRDRTRTQARRQAASPGVRDGLRAQRRVGGGTIQWNVGAGSAMDGESEARLLHSDLRPRVAVAWAATCRVPAAVVPQVPVDEQWRRR